MFFYFKTSGEFVLLLLFTIFCDYFWGLKIHQSKNERNKRWFLGLSVVINLLLLGYFKYAYFFTSSFNQIAGTSFSIDYIALPVGISFFTFQSLSYTIDMYRGRIEPVKNVLDYGFFVCFFPHLVAGPIVKAHDFIHQIYQPYRLSRNEFGMALFWILNGFCKKIVADYLAVNFVDRIFDTPHLFSGTETAIGIFGYSLQIYMDFSGYTDIAIGLALVMGFRLKANFNSPYKATSTSEFWKRWHISLSSWLQEYLYYPLGGNRHGTLGSYLALFVITVFIVLLSTKLWMLYLLLGLTLLLLILFLVFPGLKQWINTNINLMVTMLLGGLWHGSSWLFIIWGGLNGLGLVAHKLWAKISPFRDNQSWMVRALTITVTLTFISFTRIFFRSSDLKTVGMIFNRLQQHFDMALLPGIFTGYSKVMSLMAVGYLIHWIPEKTKENYRQWFANTPVPVQLLLALMLVFTMYQIMSAEMQPFIYFQF